MDMVILLVRTLFFYFLIRLLVQGMTKTDKLHLPFLTDLFVGFMVVQLSVLAIEQPAKPLILSLIPIFVLLTVHFLSKKIFTKPHVPKHPFPIQRWADTEIAEWDQEIELFPQKKLPLLLILDGQVLDSNLEQIGKTRFWLKNEIQKFEVRRFKEVAYFSMDEQGKCFLDKKSPI
jgi:hypothetical protein